MHGSGRGETPLYRGQNRESAPTERQDQRIRRVRDRTHRMGPGGFEPEPDGRLPPVGAASGRVRTAGRFCPLTRKSRDAHGVRVARRDSSADCSGSGRNYLAPRTVSSPPGSRAPGCLSGSRENHEHEPIRPRTDRAANCAGTLPRSFVAEYQTHTRDVFLAILIGSSSNSQRESGRTSFRAARTYST